MIGTDEIKMLESPVSTVVGTVDATGMPHASRAWGTWVLDGGRRMRFLVPAADTRTAENVRATGLVAFTGTVVNTLRSVQVKGRNGVVDGPATGDDRVLHERYSNAFFQAVHESDGMDVVALRNLLPDALVAVEFEVEEVFDQTPGPTAGAKLS
ncbi:MAG TPA: pyridoxamine 5'-phosphate oxidase family protein [Acidimicrobiales bacterium]|nr:pyridoxamine 5'-phosphate oxidase family protein [Acidimicrobiales bacterium]